MFNQIRTEAQKLLLFKGRVSHVFKDQEMSRYLTVEIRLLPLRDTNSGKPE